MPEPISGSHRHYPRIASWSYYFEQHSRYKNGCKDLPAMRPHKIPGFPVKRLMA
jgi:hypothetical protein